MRLFHGYLSDAIFKLFAYGPANAIAANYLLSKIPNGLPFRYQLTQIVLKKEAVTWLFLQASILYHRTVTHLHFGPFSLTGRECHLCQVSGNAV